jgi:hypothetical protein
MDNFQLPVCYDHNKLHFDDDDDDDDVRFVLDQHPELDFHSVLHRSNNPRVVISLYFDTFS